MHERGFEGWLLERMVRVSAEMRDLPPDVGHSIRIFKDITVEEAPGGEETRTMDESKDAFLQRKLEYAARSAKGIKVPWLYLVYHALAPRQDEERACPSFVSL